MPTLPQHKNGIITTPHVVILGAGASIAMTNRNQELSGKGLPSMNNLVEKVGLSRLLDDNNIKYENENFEVLFTKLKSNSKYNNLTNKIEKIIYDYFYSMKISNEVTIYDYLIMSLTEHDVIATFNWDPFLVQALARCSTFTHKLPRTVYLHGNVGTGVCYKDNTVGHIDAKCSKCNKPFKSTQLLYPIGEKDYTSNPLIKSEWKMLQYFMETAYYITIFGYSAPVSDYKAKELLLNTWKSNKSMEIAEMEIVDIQESEKLLKTWNDFIFNDHGFTTKDIFDSALFRHPRRATTELFQRTMMLKFIDEKPFPNFSTLKELYEWIKPLIDEEQNG